MNRFLIETRSEVNGNTLTGYAATFGTVADLGTSYERLSEGAFDETLKRHDVKAFYQHNAEMLLGSTGAGNLRLSTDSHGLHFELELPDVSYARDVKELVAIGALTGMSFGFKPGTDTYERAKDGKQLRTHTSVERLYEISPVSLPAYEGTSLTLRSVDIPMEPAKNRSLTLAHSRFLIARYK